MESTGVVLEDATSSTIDKSSLPSQKRNSGQRRQKCVKGIKTIMTAVKTFFIIATGDTVPHCKVKTDLRTHF